MTEEVPTRDEIAQLIRQALEPLAARLDTVEKEVFGGGSGGGGGIGASLSAVTAGLRTLAETVAAHGRQMVDLNRDLEEAIKTLAQVEKLVGELRRGKAREREGFA